MRISDWSSDVCSSDLFRLAVGAQILVAEAAGDLVVAVEARHHQQLLEQLRRLRQRKELAGMRARRHQIVARAFRRRLGQDRRLRSEEHTSELQSLMRISYAVFCLKNKRQTTKAHPSTSIRD